MKNQFTESAEQVLNRAAEAACNLGSHVIGSEHLLYGLISIQGVASRILMENDIREEQVLFEITQKIESDSKVTTLEECEMTPKLIELLDNSHVQASRFHQAKVGTEHLLLAILRDLDSIAIKILLNLEANIQKIYIDTLGVLGVEQGAAKSEFAQIRGKNQKKKSATPVLDQYARDLNAYARDGKLDPVLNRDEEIHSVIRILSRRTKNNPCLIGEPGVGKTAIAEGLAMRIEEGLVPDTIAGMRVLTLDLSGMVAGSKYRGEFEERIKKAIKETKDDGNILLFIDEIHTVIGAGSAEGTIDASNILKPSLARGEIQVIGATTREEYRKHIEKDAALERRFQPVVIEEPTAVQTIGMLKGLRKHYEDYHQVKISDEAIEAAVKLSVRYINDRFLPDKAIDLIDEAAARYRLQKVLKQDKTVQKLINEQEELAAEKEAAIVAGDFEKALEIKKEQDKNATKLLKARKKSNEKKEKKENKITDKEVAEIVAAWTKIPVNRLEQEETERLKRLESILHERVIGQEEAVQAVARAIRRGRVGLKDPKRPIGSFLFLGPTGVGKTELSKALAEAVFGSEKDMIRIDMSEYMEKQSVSKMIGSPPGYVGYEEGGQLSEKVRKKPYSVLLFDEIEKAHPDVFNMLLQVLEDGQITDAQGRQIDFKNTIIIMTSNAGANRIISPKTLGFGQNVSADEEHKKMKAGVMEEVKHIFKPEFINRIDEMIVFHTLSKENIHDIAAVMCRNFVKRVKEQMDMELIICDEVIDYVSKKGFDKDYGARPLRRALQAEVEDCLAEAVLQGEVRVGDTVEVLTKDEKVYVQKFIKNR